MNTKTEHSSGRFRKGCLFAIGGVPGLFALFLSILAGIFIILWALGGILITGDPLNTADAVVLLSGGGTERMEEAVHLYKDRFAKSFILTDPYLGTSDTGPKYSVLQEQEAKSLGIPSEAILVTPVHPNNTVGEVQELRQFLEERSIQSCIVVTDPYHTFRTRLILHDVFKGSSIKVMVRPVRAHWYQSQSWWTSRQGWIMTISEYAKIVAYLAHVGP
jgi:uncharacterized SAM-binding protein YcdF (DUF218 family)